MDQERKPMVRSFCPLNKEPVPELLEENSKRIVNVKGFQSEP